MKNIYNEEVKDKEVCYNTDKLEQPEKKTSKKKFIISMIILFILVYAVSTGITYLICSSLAR